MGCYFLDNDFMPKIYDVMASFSKLLYDYNFVDVKKISANITKKYLMKMSDFDLIRSNDITAAVVKKLIFGGCFFALLNPH